MELIDSQMTSVIRNVVLCDSKLNFLTLYPICSLYIHVSHREVLLGLYCTYYTRSKY